MVTKGTFKDPASQSYEAKYVLSYKRTNHDNMIQIGVTFFDISTLKIHVG